MKHELIGDRARVWIVTRGPDGRLHDKVDPGFFDRLTTDQSAEEIADTIAIAAGEAEIAQTRLW